MSFMGVDIGTTGCKVMAFDTDGNSLSAAYREYQVICPKPGWAELDARLVINHCKDCIAQVAASVKNRDPVAALAVSSQGEAFTAVGESGEFLCNAMVSSDTRSQKQLTELTEKLGLENLYHITGHSPHTLATLFKLAWLKENRPEVLEKAHKILCFGDLLGFELTGETTIDYSLAARTMMWDVHQKNWSHTILDAVQIDEEVLSKPVPAGQAIGKIKKRLAEQLNLSADVVVITGGHDQPCGALGAGVTEPSLATYATGTVESISPAFSKLLLNDTLRKSNLATYPHVVDQLYTTVAFNLTGGNLLRWFRDQFAAEEIKRAKETSTDPYELILKQVPSTPTNILVLPHFVATGTPYFDSSPTGAILGLDLTTSRAQLTRALLEGLTYEMRLNIEILDHAGIQIDELRAIGGGAKSDIWMQIKADIIGLPVVSLNINEGACLGAAMLAAAGSKQIKSAKEAAKRWVRPIRIFEPCKGNTRRYNKGFAIYKSLYESIKPIGRKLAKLKISI